MSPNVGNFVHDLVEMAKAMEMLPTVQAQLAAAEAKVNFQQETIQHLELRLVDRANDIDALHTKVANAEAGRDEAERMFLETDDKLIAFRRLVSAFSTDAASLLRAQEPQPEPTPIVLPAEQDTSPQGQSEAGEPAVSSTIDQSTSAPSTAESVESVKATPIEEPRQVEVSVPTDPTVVVQPNDSGSNASLSGAPSTETASLPITTESSSIAEGQGVTNPTAPSADGDTPSLASAATDAADTVADAPASASETHGPYHGKKWSEVTPRVYNYAVWEAGGGSSENFNL
jgi:hypothetical protein